MKKLSYLMLSMLTSATYGAMDKGLSSEDQAELVTICAAIATCMSVKKELDRNHSGSSSTSVPQRFKVSNTSTAEVFPEPSLALNESCELLAQRYIELILRAYKKPTYGGIIN